MNMRVLTVSLCLLSLYGYIHATEPGKDGKSGDALDKVVEALPHSQAEAKTLFWQAMEKAKELAKEHPAEAVLTGLGALAGTGLAVYKAAGATLWAASGVAAGYCLGTVAEEVEKAVVTFEGWKRWRAEKLKNMAIGFGEGFIFCSSVAVAQFGGTPTALGMMGGIAVTRRASLSHEKFNWDKGAGFVTGVGASLLLRAALLKKV